MWTAPELLRQFKATDAAAQKLLSELLSGLEEELRGIGCPTAAKAAHRLAIDLRSIEGLDEFGIRFQQLHRSINDELEAHLVIRIPPHHAEAFKKPLVGMENVTEKLVMS